MCASRASGRCSTSWMPVDTSPSCDRSPTASSIRMIAGSRDCPPTTPPPRRRVASILQPSGPWSTRSAYPRRSRCVPVPFQSGAPVALDRATCHRVRRLPPARPRVLRRRRDVQGFPSIPDPRHPRIARVRRCGRGEMQQRHILGPSRMDGKARGRRGHLRTKRHAALGRRIAKDQPRHVGPPVGHLAAILRLGRDQNAGAAHLHPRPHGFGAKGGKQRADHDLGLERAKRGGVKVRHPPRQQEQSLARIDTMGAQHMGKARDLCGRIRERG